MADVPDNCLSKAFSLLTRDLLSEVNQNSALIFVRNALILHILRNLRHGLFGDLALAYPVLS